MYDEFVEFLEYNYRRWEEYMFFISEEHSFDEEIIDEILEDYDNLLMSKPHWFAEIVEMYENDNDSFCKHLIAAFSAVYPELEEEFGRKTVRFAIYDRFGN